MNLTENGKKLWTVAVSLLMVVFFCGFAGYLKEKNSELLAQQEMLCSEWQRRAEQTKLKEPEKEMYDSRARLDVYPSESGAEQHLDFIMDLEQKFGICISSVSCGEPEILLENGEWCLTGSRVEFTAELSMEALKQMIDDILSREEKNRILELSFRPDAKREAGTAVFCVYRYGKKEEIP